MAGADVKVTVLRDDTPHLVIDIAGDAQPHGALALQRAGGIGQAGRLQLQAGVLAVDQTIGVVLHGAGRGEQELTAGRNGAALAVVQIAGEQGQQTLAGQLTALVVDLAAVLDQQRTGAGQFAIGVGQGAEQVEGQRAVADQTPSAVVQRGAGVAQVLLRRDHARGVTEGHGVQDERRPTVDQAVLPVVQQATHRQGLVTTAGQNAAAVVEAPGVDGQRLLADQGTTTAVEQRTTGSDTQVTAAAGEGAVVAVIQARRAHVEALPTGEQAILVEQSVGTEAQQLAADQFAVAVIEGAGGQIKTLAAGDFAALVVQVMQVVEAQHALGGDQAVLVVQVTAL
ncbi:hypothetical protein PS880_06207 [Pseudomonas fluorescens]|uniref:Uncharacterized protein n=1 Tax=Pseudomonas fluorescens TaxID=294 RepID=A0A5E7QGA5_PSEFL|nr:hypothetical protein PS880_06207 [Pseudomonas fluorescens]